MRKAQSKYNQQFETILQGLNPEQREAVDQIDGPTMVLAGPGTGKTQLISARIGKILLDTDTQAHNILCLTFTDAAAKAMRKRLATFIGPEAHRVHIYTFHSFCNSVIQDNGERFGRQGLEPISELERVEIIRDILSSLPPKHRLIMGRADPWFYEGHLARLFAQMKSENWTVELLEKAVKAYIEDLPMRSDYQYQRKSGPNRKGDPKQALIDEEKRKMELLLAAARLYPAYQEALQQAGRYDYDDMIRWVLEAFQEDENLLLRYQERYLYFLVDEYQDTNGSQNAILRLLISYWERPNLFVVGDDDQSIYEFQGARLHNLVELYEAYRDYMNLVVLKRNYRSTQHILDRATGLIDHNDLRLNVQLPDLKLEKDIVAALPERANSPSRPELRQYPNRLHETTDLANRIGRLLASGTDPAEIAVIYAKHKQAEDLAQLLDKRGVTYTISRKTNLLDAPLIEQLHTLLRYLDAELKKPFSGEALLFKLLHARWLGLDVQDLSSLSLYRAHKGSSREKHWRKLLSDSKTLRSRKDLRNPVGLLRVGEFLQQSISDAANLSLPHLLERLINRSGMLEYVMELPDREWWIQALASVSRFVQEESRKRRKFDLRQLLDVWQRMEANGLPLEMSRNLETGEGIQLVTAHSAKGLEFEHVFVIDLTKDQWEPNSRGGRYRFALPDTLTLSGEEDPIEARRRLLYVAMTRAKEGLYLSWSKNDNKDKETSPARFVDELAASQELPSQEVCLNSSQLLEAQYELLREKEPVRLEGLPKALIDELLEDFSLSVSSLNQYLDCPLGFYYKYVLRVPTPSSNPALYGTAVHSALQRCIEMSDPVSDDLLRYFRQEMARLRAQFDPSYYEHKLQQGLHNLEGYFQKRHTQWPRRSVTEYHVRKVEIAGVPAKGVIDRIDLPDGREALIVDYKTGRYDKNKFRGPTKKNPHGTGYWRQIIFYRLLMDASPAFFERHFTKGVLSFVDPDKEGQYHEFELIYNPKDLQLVQELVVGTWKGIQDHEFLSGCGEPDCPWCKFVRQHQEVRSFAREAIEGLDDPS